MAYLKRWRHYTAEVLTLAQSSDEDINNDAIPEIPPDILPGPSFDSDSTQQDSDSNVNTEDSVLDASDSDFSATSQSEISIEAGEFDDDNTIIDLVSDLSAWASKHKCTRIAINELLEILRNQGHRLPKDARTLMKTPRLVQSEEKCGGQYKYFGIESGLTKLFSNQPEPTFPDAIELTFNIDGVPLYKSNTMQLWPILCSANDLEPFIVAVFYGSSKPKSVNEYLSDFLEELHELCENGIDINRRTEIKVKAFICDAPARSFLKCIKSHNGYNSCERCQIRGVWDGCVLYNIPQDDSDLPELRTDAVFANHGYPEHQTSYSPLLHANVLCISGFPLDYMHLVCLGVVKRILTFLKDGPRECKLSTQQIRMISDKLCKFNGKLPREFARQPRSLTEMDRWKATEFRQFLLYTGPVVLRSILSKETYEHFLSLMVAISILLTSNNGMRNHYLDFANDLLRYFVRKAVDIYGNRFVSYNVHALIHIADDAKHFDSSLNKISAFKFENHLQKLKKCVRNAKNPIAQISKRAMEFEMHSKEKFFKLRFPFISTKLKDSCYLTTSGKFAFIHEKRKKTMVCDVFRQRDLESFFKSPCDSKVLNICTLKNNRRSKRMLLEKQDLERKVVCLEDERGLVLMPMLHDIERLA